ncbi:MULTISPECIES: HAD family phosphatase [unclassified Lactococcus]|uniref:HAD family hydrolase n=1 Tax=unclassified Lactococcus TaxID=2643510 RepID=UPI0011CA3764|nr:MULTISPECIES: HAD family phosphatase [unclassified Lactococcus]MQW22737.1 HAD-IA family hydrolase [Lactococcus sp. dk101]TXK44742.1 HAD family phosphatase [Lactococcus sp. dk310]TXK50636.1 HAD family phosphatase [Lactococcus sp. dk322]
MMIKNIIFDLGGVIIDLGFDEMTRKFEALGVENFSDYFNFNAQNAYFIDLELGKITPEEFYEKLRQQSQTQLSDAQIKASWNLILKEFNPERMALLENLAKKYPLYLFSNTNAIHAECFEARCLSTFGKPLSAYFVDVHYSHDLHLRKPSTQAFEQVLKNSNLKAEETLFIDDNADNIAGAKQVGLHTYHLKPSETILDLDFEKMMQGNVK